MNSIWSSKETAVQKYLDAIYEEVLKEKEVPTAIGVQLTEVLIEEMAKNFDKKELSHGRVIQLLNPFLKTLCQTQRVVLFQKTRDNVFNKLIETNGIDADEDGELYFPKFDIVEYAEHEMHEMFSSDETLDSRREDVYNIYQKSSGCERIMDPFVSFEDKIQQRRLKSLLPKTKHQKKQCKRLKIVKSVKMKRRILKMIANQQYSMFPQINNEVDDEEQLARYTNPEYGRMEDITKKILERMNELKSTIGDLQSIGDGTGGTGDEFPKSEQKSSKKLKKAKPIEVVEPNESKK